MLYLAHYDMTSEVTPDVRSHCCRLSLIIICFLDRKTGVEGGTRWLVGEEEDVMRLYNSVMTIYLREVTRRQYSAVHPTWRRVLLIFPFDGNFR